ncbi:hypothetical protein [Actinoalloteichus hymeniacidonis]|uniref:Uncharacterized protein n=1 Tax=Actinoalloteichus hymeniacidonis TaxID=340345 RepID=A0AAC9HLM1_9PSEU|nr:hypothetical protein [Actinoalloteichus hymeniacidonis]AOS61041.1 hypothetical protein TL08_00985 [Actinoalloteichus hymeniacidonis]MBB5910959.1 hypothetical protein [Actinoalloteichus hymeniacidonis]
MTALLVLGVLLIAAGFPLVIWGYRPPPTRRRTHIRTVAFASIMARLVEERLAMAVGS